jgi:F0F1-type ATP synthase assembly protein I
VILFQVVEQASKSGMGDIIRAAVAPVFLLSGIGAFVLVLTQRLARVMDRLHADGHDAVRDPGGRSVLQRRARYIITGLRLLTLGAHMVSAVVVALFLDYFTDLPLDSLVAVLFIGAMILLSAALFCLLREVGLINQGAPEDS